VHVSFGTFLTLRKVHDKKIIKVSWTAFIETIGCSIGISFGVFKNIYINDLFRTPGYFI
jgi:hypothetical protein